MIDPVLNRLLQVFSPLVNHWQNDGYVDILKSFGRHFVVSQDSSQDQRGQPRAALGHAHQ